MNTAQSFGGALSQWLTLHTLNRKPKSQQFNREIVGVIHSQWPGWINARVSSITSEQVTEFAQRVAHYCPSRWNAIVGALQFVTPAARSLERRPLCSKERRLVSQLEFARLLEELDKRPRSHGGLVIRFLAHTGLRIDEARQLRWSDVHADFLLVPGSMTKNGRPRSIPFVTGLGATLDRLRVVTGGAERILPQAECKRSLKFACRLVGLPPLSHHDFRHLFATRCIESGVDVPTVARWLGHSDGGALLTKRYFHLLDDHSRKMAQKVKIAG